MPTVIFLSPILIHGIELRPLSLREITPRSTESAPPFSCIKMSAVFVAQKPVGDFMND